MINDAIKQDQQKLFGNIVSFKDFIQKMGYEIQFDQCYKVSSILLLITLSKSAAVAFMILII